VDTNGHHEQKNQWYVLNVKAHTGTKKEKRMVEMREKEKINIRIIKPIGMIKKTTKTLPSGKQMQVMRRDNTLTNIYRRIPL